MPHWTSRHTRHSQGGLSCTSVAWAALSLTVVASDAVLANNDVTTTWSLPDTIQMSPLGYSGAINTPTADVLPVGSTLFAISNSIPERSRKYPGIGAFGGINWGFGVLPGLELVGRLTYDGSVQCNIFAKNCPTDLRDLSLSGKYQLPVSLPYNSRLAVGFTDYGGSAAVNYRQLYAVGTTSYGPVDASVGYSKGSKGQPLMDGFFGNLTLRMNDQLAVMLESDTQAYRLGAHYLQPLTNNIDLQMGISRKLSGSAANQQANQFTAALRYQLDKKLSQANRKKQLDWAANSISSVDAAVPVTLDQRAVALSNRLAANGFANIHIAALPASDGYPLLWWVRAEPVGWRKDHQDALGAGLVQWMLGQEAADSEMMLSLTYMGQPTSSVHTSRNCLHEFMQGKDTCNSKKTLPLHFLSGSNLPVRLQIANPDQILNLVNTAAPFAWRPQIELGLNLRSAVGTELGLADYSAALNIGIQAEISKIGLPESWGKGWMWQGNVLIPVSHSEDFDKNKTFYALGHQKTELDQALLSYWRYVDTPWFKNIAVQGSIGSVNAYSRGGQLDAVWTSDTGDLRVGATAGSYSRRKASGTRNTQIPTLISVRQSVIPSQWHLEGTFGKFLAGDTGYKIASHHWYGDYRLSFYVRETKGSFPIMPKTRFAGFEISLPLGSKESVKSDIGTIRMQDRWSWGLSSKVGQSNNIQAYGYGETPRPRHGIWTDIIDYDRTGSAEMWGRRETLRGALQKSSP